MYRTAKLCTFAVSFFCRFLCAKNVKSVFVVRMRIKSLFMSRFFYSMFYAFMFYARIKWPPGPNFLCAHKTDTHINIKRKSAYVEPVCHKNTRTSHATTNNKKSCAHPTLQRLCPPLFMGRAEAPPNHVNAAPHHHTEAASCRGLLVWGDLK